MSRLLRAAARGIPAGALLAATASAQATTTSGAVARPEVRVDAIFGSRPAVHAGAGIQLPAGTYIRVGLVGGVGVRTDAVAGSRASGRVDLTGRFLLDPLRQAAVGLSVGGGLTARFEQGERVTPALLVLVDAEQRGAIGGWTPAVQLGLGGGARLGVVLRRARGGAR